MRLFLFALSLFAGQLLFAQIPAGYYDAATGTGDVLRANLRDIITTGHVKLPYTSTAFDVWDAYQYTDVTTSGGSVIWDMYSDVPGGTPSYTFTIFNDQCGTASQEGDCYSREHMMPNSWWGGLDNASNPQYTDLHHLPPCDQYVNNRKSNYIVAETSTPTYTSSNGSKVGPCSLSGFSGTVFEPINAYKGDFARAYLYLATRYMDYLSIWRNTYTYDSQYIIATSGGNYLQWYIDLLVRWHLQDPVSQKEIDRNNAIYYNTPQHNRNPYIDHPEYVCLVWSTTACNTVPIINNIVQTPLFPGPVSTVSVTADVTDDGSITSAVLQWCTDGISFSNSISMSLNGAPNYITSASIPAQTAGTTVTYRIIATDNDGNSTTSAICSYTVLKPEPTNHPTGFSCGTSTNTSITLTWTDATGTVVPDYYLIKGSNTSLASITDPVDGTPESDAALVKNISAGVQSVTFAGLTTASTYYFKIYPYTNSSSNVNYKTSPSAPEATCSTLSGSGGGNDCATDLFISEYVEGSGNNKYIEIYNGTGVSVDLSDYRLRLYPNGATTPTTDLQLSGTLANGSVKVYSNSAGVIYTTDTTITTATFYNGDDALALYKISTGSFVDIMGRIGEDPGTAWVSGSVSMLNMTLVRNSDVTGGITTNPSSGFPTLGTEWTAYAQDDATHLGWHTMTCPIPDTVTSSATPGCSTGSVTLISNATASQTFYLLTGTGTPVDSWTGTSGSHTFTGLASGSYKGYTINSGITSIMSDIVVLANDPLSVGGTLSGTLTEICAGENSGVMTLSSYTGSVTRWMKSNDGGATWTDIANTDEIWSEDISVSGTWMFMAEVINGSCAAANSSVFSITVDPVVTPLFSQAGPYCQNSIPATLPATSTNGVTGVWSPSAISTASAGTILYTFTPTTGQCATTASMTVVVNANTTPVFTQAGPYCQGATPATLPTTSSNGVTGTWNPSTISTASAGTTLYTFTPTAGQCALTATMNVEVYSSYSFSENYSMCQGETYTWHGSSYATAGTYTKTYSTTNGCDSTYTLTLTVNPTYSFSENQSICQGSSYTWHGTTYSTAGVFTKNYSTINGCDSIYSLNLTVIPTYAFSENHSTCNGESYTWQGNTYTAAGIYTRTYVSAGGCDSVYTLNLTVNPDYSFSENHAICYGESYSWHGNTYGTAGTYNAAYTTINGCDSIYTLHLTVHPTYTFSENHEICQGDSYSWQGGVYTSPGTFSKTYTTINGCDSVYTLSLTVYPEYSFSENHAVCQGSSYIWHGTTYSSPGVYTKNYSTIHGCDSTYTLNLTQIPSYAFSENHTICSGDSYVWQGNTYTAAGIYSANYTSVGGCDSVYTLNLTVNPSYAFSENRAICEGESYLWRGTNYSTAGSYVKNYVSAKGCDSTYTLNLTVNPVYSFSENHAICNGDSYTWQGNTYSTAGTYTAVYSTVNGCDSIYTLHLTVNPTYAFNESHSICNGDSYTWHGNTYSATGTYTATYTSASGCDSIYTLNLTVNPVYTFNENHSMCQGENYVWHGTTYSTTGVYTKNLTSVNGCDSTYILNLTVYPAYAFFDMAEICQGENYVWHGNTYTTAGTYEANYTSVHGCDSTYTLLLIVHPAYAFSENQSVCQGSSYTWHGNVYTTAGTYTAAYSTIFGCDSIYTLHLSEVTGYSFVDNHSLCNGESFTWHGNTYTTAGTYYANYVSTSGCDSIYTLNLTVNPTYAFNESHSICNGDSYTWQGNTYTAAGTYTAAYTTAYGCDSVYTLNLSVNPTYAFNESHSICNGDSYTWQGNTYATAGTYTVAYTTINGCDSIYTLNLTVNPTYAFVENHSICNGNSYIWQGNTYTVAGTYTAAYTTVNGCDSIYTLNLSEVTSYSFVENHSICNGESYLWQGSTYTAAGTYTAAFVSSSGCDSIYTLNLSVNPTYAFNESHSICNGDSYTWQGNSYTAAGTFTASYTTVNGCDSIYTLNLSVNPTYAFDESHSICNGESYSWQGTTYTSAGTYTAVYSTVNGCDSVYTLNLTVHPTYNFNESHSMCDGESYTWQGNTYATAGTYSAAYTTVNGCDSIYTLNLSVTPTFTFNETQSICSGGSYTWHGTIYSTAGVYTKAYTTSHGCDSIYTLNLIVYPSYHFSENQALCQGSSYTWHGTTYNAPGTYTKSYTTVHGCDSIYTLNLTVIASYAFSENHSICSSESYYWQGNTYTSPGIYAASYVSSGGCDSVYTLNLTVYPKYLYNENHAICQGESFSWKGSVYTTAGVYTKNYTTIHGCDSIYILNLTVYPSYQIDEYQSICNGDSYTWRGTTYSLAGDYTKTYPTIHGCDSVYILHLTVNPTFAFSENHAICQGSTYTWHGTTYSAPGVYTKSYSTVTGCDSIYTLNLTEISSYAFSENQSICSGDSYFWQGNNYTAAGIYTAVYTTASGCDSVYTLNLTVNSGYAFNESHSICDGDSYSWQGNNYSAAGVYTATYTSVNGCDSVYTLNLTINPVYTFNENHSICQGSSYTWQGSDYSSPGIYTRYYNSINGCDSIYILNLTEVAGYAFTENQSICQGETFTWQGSTYTSDGTYTAAFISSSGCDSIYTLNLTVNPTYVTLSGVEVCNGDMYTWRGNSYSVAGTYYDSLHTQTGCDSVFVLNLTVNPSYAFNESYSMCDGESYSWQGNSYTTSGNYTAAYTTVNGCDSIYTLNLTVNPTYAFNESHSICNGDSYSWQGNTYTAAGTYTAAYTTVNGCDSIYILNLAVNPTYTFNESHSICNSDSYTWHGNTYTSPGTYTAAYTTVNGCDSIYTLNLTVNPTYAFNESHSICNGDIYTWQGNTYTAAGTYTASYTTVNGCDSVYTLNLTVNPTYAFNENHSICDGESYSWQGNIYTAAGNYTATYATSTGCDSTYTLNLFVNPLPVVWLGNDTTICADAFITLDAGNPGATYLWSEGNATSQSVTIDSTGHGASSFPVSVTVNNGCQSSDTINITIEICDVLDENGNILFSVYPNPSDGIIYITGNSSNDAAIELTDATGKLVYKGKNSNLNGSDHTKEFDLGVYPAGVYFLKIGNTVVRLVRQ